MKLIRWKDDPEVSEHHRHDYRWYKTKEETDTWIKKNWEVEDDKPQK